MPWPDALGVSEHEREPPEGDEFQRLQEAKRAEQKRFREAYARGELSIEELRRMSVASGLELKEARLELPPRGY
jgi:hypothetical protein